MNAAGSSPIESLLTFTQASKLLNISIRQVYRLIAEGKFPVVMIGKRSPRIQPSDLRQYLESRTIHYGAKQKCA
jgi:excisionase family DNA binding protein